MFHVEQLDDPPGKKCRAWKTLKGGQTLRPCRPGKDPNRGGSARRQRARAGRDRARARVGPPEAQPAARHRWRGATPVLPLSHRDPIRTRTGQGRGQGQRPDGKRLDRGAATLARSLGLIPHSRRFLPIQLEPMLEYSQLMTMPTATAATATRHASDCTRVFNRLDPKCPRCAELRNGAPARAGWSDNKRRCEAVQRASIAAHFAPDGPHARGLCGPVCTFGDW